MASPNPPKDLKPILSSGLGVHASTDPNAAHTFGPDVAAKITDMLATAKQTAEEKGFELVLCDADPADPEGTMRRITAALRGEGKGPYDGKKWVAVNVGFGVRGHKEHSALFERIVNKVVAVRPGTRLLFSSGPYDIVNCIERNRL